MLRKKTANLSLSLSLIAVLMVALLVTFFPDAVRNSATTSGVLEDLTAVRVAVFARRSRSFINDYVRTQSVRRLQIGSGSNRHEGWLNTDIEQGEGLAYLDATKPFPLDSGSFHYVFSEHVIVHLTYEQGTHMLAESYRILAPGGKVRVTTPNLLRFVGLFQEQKSDEMERYIAGKLAWHGWPPHPTTEATILNLQLSSFGHKFVYDPGTLAAAMTHAGFESIQEFSVGESNDPNLRSLERRQDYANAYVNEYETMILQAVKPSADLPRSLR